MELPRSNSRNVIDLRNAGFQECRVILKGNKIFPVVDQKPESQMADVRDFIERSARSRSRWTHPGAPARFSRSSQDLSISDRIIAPTPQSVRARIWLFHQRMQCGHAYEFTRGYWKRSGKALHDRLWVTLLFSWWNYTWSALMRNSWKATLGYHSQESECFHLRICHFWKWSLKFCGVKVIKDSKKLFASSQSVLLCSANGRIQLARLFITANSAVMRRDHYRRPISFPLSFPFWKGETAKGYFILCCIDCAWEGRLQSHWSHPEGVLRLSKGI